MLGVVTRGSVPGAAPAEHAVLADAAALGLSGLAGVLAGAPDGIMVFEAQRCVYANPAACQMLGQRLEQLRGRNLRPNFKAREQAARVPLGKQSGDMPSAFTCLLTGFDGTEREIFCSAFAIEVSGRPHRVAIFRELTDPEAAARTAVASARTAAELVGTGSTEEILIGLARHAFHSTRASACGIVAVGDDHKLATAGSYRLPAPLRTRDTWTATSITLDDLPGGEVLLTGKTVVLPDARAACEASPVLAPYAATLKELDWEGAVFVPLSWEEQVLGVFWVYLPSGVSEPTEGELALYHALARQAAMAVANARLAASLERTRLARELHDSVSQALFSMTMHARAAQLSMEKAGVDKSSALGRSIAELGELTRGALAEMRALIFELRPGALAEEGLVAALRKQAAALTAREQVTIDVDASDRRLHLGGGVEEHLYRIVAEALHNVVKHAAATRATVRVTDERGKLRVEVTDDGAGFDPDSEHVGHLGLSTMADRAAAIGAELTITSAPGAGTIVAVSVAHERRDARKPRPHASRG